MMVCLGLASCDKSFSKLDVLLVEKSIEAKLDHTQEMAEKEMETTSCVYQLFLRSFLVWASKQKSVETTYTTTTPVTTTIRSCSE